MKIATDSNTSTSIDLLIANYPFSGQSISFIDKFSPLLLAIQFTSLFISSSKFSIEIFVQIINLLPNLDSLNVFYLSLPKTTSLSYEDIESLRLLSINNKIRRIWQLMDFETVELFTDLCPHMEYFKVRGVESNDLENLVRLILRKTITHIRQLHSVCFYVYDANDQITYDLQKIIESEKLLFRVTRKCNDIFLQWIPR